MMTKTSTQKTKLVVIGDSTSGTKLGICSDDTIGWSEYMHLYVNTDVCEPLNKCMIGWGIRDFFNRDVKMMDRIVSSLNEGDLLIASFGTLERSALSKTGFGARGSLPGKGKESQIVYDIHYKKEYEVFTFGEYLRMLADMVKERGAKLFFMSQIPRNTWENGKHKRTYSIEYAKIMSDIAEEKNVGFFDANEILSAYLDIIGEEVSKQYYHITDKSHTTELGASVFARIIMTQIKDKYKKDFEPIWK